jgi:cytochrome P450
VPASSTSAAADTPDAKNEKKLQLQLQQGSAPTAMTPKTFPKAPIYEISRKTLAWMTDEAEYREHVRRVGHVFSPALMPALETVIRAELAPLLRALDERRGGAVDMLHWFRMFALDIAGE